MRSLGETEFVNGISAMSASGAYGPTRVAAGIVGLVDLTIGSAAEDVLRAHMAAAGPRFKGIRYAAAWEDKADEIHNSHTNPPQYLYRDHARFREGFAALGKLGLTFDAWLYHPQIPDLTALARAFPAQPIVLDHVGGPLGLGWYADKRQEIFAGWKRDIVELAGCPNVTIKLGGIGMRVNGFKFHHRELPPIVQGPRRRLAALRGNLHRGLRSQALHVREQLPGRQDLGLLRDLLERLQAPCLRRLRRRQGRALPRDGQALLSARLSSRPLPTRGQTLETAQHERGAPLRVAGIIKSQPRQAAQKGRDRDLGLDARELGAEAEVDAAAERQRTDVGAG